MTRTSSGRARRRVARPGRCPRACRAARAAAAASRPRGPRRGRGGRRRGCSCGGRAPPRANSSPPYARSMPTAAPASVTDVREPLCRRAHGREAHRARVEPAGPKNAQDERPVDPRLGRPRVRAAVAKAGLEALGRRRRIGQRAVQPDRGEEAVGVGLGVEVRPGSAFACRPPAGRPGATGPRGRRRRPGRARRGVRRLVAAVRKRRRPRPPPSPELSPPPGVWPSPSPGPGRRPRRRGSAPSPAGVAPPSPAGSSPPSAGSSPPRRAARPRAAGLHPRRAAPRSRRALAGSLSSPALPAPSAAGCSSSAPRRRLRWPSRPRSPRPRRRRRPPRRRRRRRTAWRTRGSWRAGACSRSRACARGPRSSRLGVVDGSPSSVWDAVSSLRPSAQSAQPARVNRTRGVMIPPRLLLVWH